MCVCVFRSEIVYSLCEQRDKLLKQEVYERQHTRLSALSERIFDVLNLVRVRTMLHFTKYISYLGKWLSVMFFVRSVYRASAYIQVSIAPSLSLPLPLFRSLIFSINSKSPSDYITHWSLCRIIIICLSVGRQCQAGRKGK